MNDKYWTCAAMTACGGSFVNRLGHALLAADPANYAAIKSALPEIFERYEALGAQLKQEDEKKP